MNNLGLLTAKLTDIEIVEEKKNISKKLSLFQPLWLTE